MPILRASEATAFFSPDKVYRYSLERHWEKRGPLVMFIGLNPSTADETKDDPTIRRCIGFARVREASGLVMANLFAYRATDPYIMRQADDPIGPDNDSWLTFLALRATYVIAAWGVHGSFQGRDQEVLKLLAGKRIKVSCLGTTKAGLPRHPLYLRSDTELVPYANTR